MLRGPGIASTFWFLAFVAVSILFVFKAPKQKSESDDIVFGIRVFYDSAKTSVGEGVVAITGTLTGEGIGYKNNTVAIMCLKQRGLCHVSSIDQIGPKLLSRLVGPNDYEITQWDASEVMATDSGTCRKITINISRQKEAALWVEEPINQTRVTCKDEENKTYKWTIEDPPFWKAARK